MSDNNNFEAVEEPQDTATPTVEQPESTAEQTTESSAEPVVANLMKQVESLRHESAQYRTERNTAREQLTVARRQLLSANENVRYLLDPSAIGDVLDGMDVDNLFAEDGSLDEQALEQAVRDVVAAKPYVGNPAQHRLPQSVREVLSHSAPHLRTASTSDPLAAALLRR